MLNSSGPGPGVEIKPLVLNNDDTKDLGKLCEGGKAADSPVLSTAFLAGYTT